METNQTKILNRIIVKYAIIAAALYVAYFGVMKIFGLEYHTELRYLNYVIYFIAGYYALKEASHSRHNDFNYLQGFGVGFVVGTLSFILFAAFVFIYSFFGSFFIDAILKDYPSANVMGRFAPPFLIVAEGTGFSAIFSLCLMQFFRIFTGRAKNIPVTREKQTVATAE